MLPRVDRREIAAIFAGGALGTLARAALRRPLFTLERVRVCKRDGQSMPGPGGTGAGGTGAGGGPPGSDGGTSMQCPPGTQVCGLPGQAPCASGYYCITGCCQKVPT